MLSSCSDNLEYHMSTPSKSPISRISTKFDSSYQRTSEIESPEKLFGASATNSTKLPVLSQESFFLTEGLEDIFVDDCTPTTSSNTTNFSNLSFLKPHYEYIAIPNLQLNHQPPDSKLINSYEAEKMNITELSTSNQLRIVSPEKQRHDVPSPAKVVDTVLRATEAMASKGQINYSNNHFCIPLGCKNDASFFSPFLCFVRSNCVEAFTATKGDIVSKKIELGQIGLRCQFCAHKRVKERENGSFCYPSTIYHLPHSVSNFIEGHFRICSEIPEYMRNHIITLKATHHRIDSKSESGRKINSYWGKSARMIGLIHIQKKRGIYHNTYPGHLISKTSTQGQLLPYSYPKNLHHQ